MCSIIVPEYPIVMCHARSIINARFTTFGTSFAFEQIAKFLKLFFVLSPRHFNKRHPAYIDITKVMLFIHGAAGLLIM
jgi:hypothetical protein